MKKSVLFCVLLLSAAAAVFAKGMTESDVPFAPAMLDNILAGIAEKDYDMFSRDFSAAMKDAVTEDGFSAVLAALDGKLGTYEGRTFLSAGRTRSDVGVITIVTYKARYSKDPDARIRIWISEKDGVRRIEGFLTGPAGELK